ncbi:MAG: hypothetical protein COX62_01395 [Deltaproteobacteria bacterium CG_4_10_14_0_2_um_filter_43_8]|nr:MAG: hypothetical protein COV43_04445 [Deltaproteobacteria bacterium CG11_big_fil_rev_8_21_14_0_20_42_23]PJA21807.1 MAG: hypothetical protein COX62_01395 [Deltaproteobacteria bacterium CG_4_10_14_0_2_um_filter_43_8]PJC65024.1 MAG: hypothetical protein CO021_00835 [Deltaproteobacteria bacterium CG_4_9_14_0_2_um_filter_42_21]
MSDIGLSLYINNQVVIDLDVLSSGLKLEDGLRTAVLISLFTDQRAEENELPFGHDDKRGWWGDMISQVEGDEIGSKLWILERNKQTQPTLNDFEQFARKSLEWMIEDGVASNVEVVARYPEREIICLNINITRPSGDAERYEVLWNFEKDGVIINAV